MKFIFWGGKAIGNFILKGLLDKKHIPAAIIYYREELEDDLIERSKHLGVKVLQIQKFRSSQDKLQDFVKAVNPEMYISISFPFIISKEILDLVEYPINIHTSAIPKYRGHHPIPAALLNDEPFQATTVHFMVSEVDAGRILLQDFIEVCNEDTIVTIRQRLIELSFELLIKVIQQVEKGTLYPKKQIGETVWAPQRTPKDSKLDLSKPSRYLHNFIRALVDPYPNAFVFKGDKRIQIKKSIACNEPGLVLAKLNPKEYIISSGDGVVFIETDTELFVGDKLE